MKFYTEANSDVNHLMCLVCKKVVKEMENEVDKINPKKQIQIGTYGFDNKHMPKKIEYRRSEIFLTDLMDTVCEKMENYARATYKSNGELTIIPLIEDGKMNPILDRVNLVTDANLNRSLKHYCHQILNEYGEDILKLFQTGGKDIHIHLCTQATKLCNDDIDEEYVFEDWKDEL